MEKIALVLFVKDEAEEISWWMAWHLSMGIDTLLIYDDRSTDGTWEIINAASEVLDVRCFRTPETLMFQHRQGQTYMKALDDHRDEFDWIGFLDGDEYLDLRHSPDMHHFLAQYHEADAVAISWCCYGNNGHIVRPGPYVLESFTRHSKEEFVENRYVKSFIRPKKTKSTYYNPHRFDVEGKYVMTDGSDIQWEPPLLQWTEARRDWSQALIRHFVIRSVEHYVEKFKRRGDLRTSNLKMSFFDHYNKNDVSEKIDSRKLGKVYPFIYEIQHRISIKAYIDMKKKLSIRLLFNTPDTRRKTNTTLYDLTTFCGSSIVVNGATGQLGHAFLGQEADGIEPLVAFMNDDDPGHLYITSQKSEDFIYCSYDSRVSTVLAYEIVRMADEKVALRCPNTRKFLCFDPTPLENSLPMAEADANREWANDWETVTLKPIHSKDDYPEKIRSMSSLMYSWPPEVDTLTEDETTIDYMADALIARLSTLGNNEILKWRLNNNVIEMPWIQSNSRISF